MKDVNVLKQRYQNQIDELFNTLVEIQKLEHNVWPMEHISNRAKTSLWMCMQSMLMRGLWDKFEEGKLTKEQRLEIVTLTWDTTYKHYKELYWYDAKQCAE